jgi:AcrR family transcriptional regulator
MTPLAPAGPPGNQRDQGQARPASGEPALRADAQRNRARILAAASQVFAELGPSASTEEVARRAGVAIGTVFRHFPTKDDLLRAIMKDLLQRLTAQVSQLAADGDPATALFGFITGMVEQAAARMSVVDLLAAAGNDIQVADALQALRHGVAELLARAQQAGAVRPDIQVAEVMALITSTCQGALQGGWDGELQGRALAIIFAGLRAPPVSA